MTNWIPTKENPNGSITIKGTTYSVTSSDYEVRDGYVLECDWNHSGSIYFTAEVAAKYGLEDCLEPDDEHEEFVNDWGKEYEKFTHWKSVNHYTGTINGDGERVDRQTPWGECYSQEMWCAMEEINPEFFNEPGVFICGWSDG